MHRQIRMKISRKLFLTRNAIVPLLVRYVRVDYLSNKSDVCVVFAEEAREQSLKAPRPIVTSARVTATHTHTYKKIPTQAEPVAFREKRIF